MDFMKEYEKWLSSPVLSDAERAELESIKNDPKEIETRFFGPLSLVLPVCAAPWVSACTA